MTTPIRVEDFSPGLITEVGEVRLPMGTAKAIRNFRVDKKGSLKTASGPLLAFSATGAGVTDMVRQLLSWVNPADGVRWVFAVVNQAIYGFSGVYRQGSAMTVQYALLADWAQNPRNAPAVVPWRSSVLMVTPVDHLLRFDGAAWGAVAARSGSDPNRTYLATLPTGCGIEVYGERLYILDESKVCYSEPGEYDVFDENGFFYVRRDDGHEGSRLKLFAGQLIIFKEDSVDSLVGGSPADGGYLRSITTGSGLLAPNSLVETADGRFLLWLSREGVMRMDRAGGVVNITPGIRGEVVGLYSRTASVSEAWDEAAAQDEAVVLGDETMVIAEEAVTGAELVNVLTGVNGLQVSVLEYAAGAHRDGCYHLSIPMPDGTVRTFVGTVDEEVPRWTVWEGEGMGGVCMCRMAGSTDPDYILAGKQDKPEVVALDAGGPLPLTAIWESYPMAGMGQTATWDKAFRRMRAVPQVENDSAPFDLGFKVNPGDGAAAEKTGAVTITPNRARPGRQKFEKSLPMNAVGVEIALTVETAGPLDLAALEVEMLPKRAR